MDREFAPTTVHESIAAPPLEMDVGAALKALIEGGSFLRRSASASAEYDAAVGSLDDSDADPPQPATALSVKAMMMKMPRFLSIVVVVPKSRVC
jgi:hypothetical protein